MTRMIGAAGLRLEMKRTAVWASVVVGIAAAAILAEWPGCPGHATLRGALRIIAYGLGAMGVGWLGCRYTRLARTVASMARQLQSDAALPAADRFAPPARPLAEAIHRLCTTLGQSNQQLRDQVDEMSIQVHVAQRQKANIEAILYSLRDAVVVVDEFDRLLMANEAAGKLLGVPLRDATVAPIGELLAADKVALLDLLGRSRQTKGQAMRQEIELVVEGTPRVFDCIVSCVNDAAGRACGAVVVLHDITREKEISQMKNDFVSHVSHELKTPLASITAYSEMLVDGEADDEQTRKEFYAVIQNQAKRLNRMIEDILNIARIESGLIKVNREPLSLTILIEEQLQMLKSYAEEKGIELTAQDPIVYDQVYADKDMMTQVIVNLLSNAIKYTPAGGKVRIETEVDETSRAARVRITDTGVGIPADEIGHLFEKFYRVQANNKQAKGTGLGLNLVKQIVETVHHGRVFVTSQVGVGSTFGFELPLASRELSHAV